MTTSWQRTLMRLSALFLQQGDKHRVGTLVVHASDTEDGKKALDGPPNKHGLRKFTGLSKTRWVIPPAKARTMATIKPLRAIYFGGDKEGSRQFVKLCQNVGNLLDTKEFKEKLEPEFRAYPTPIDNADFIGQNPALVAWVLLVHHMGMQTIRSAAFDLDRYFWDDEGFQSYDNYKKKKRSLLPAYFTYSFNTCEDSAATIDLLLSTPPRDSWITIPTATEAIARSRRKGINSGHVSRLVKKGILKGRGEGRNIRVSPASVIDFIIEHPDREPPIKAGNDDEDEIKEPTPSQRKAIERQKVIEQQNKFRRHNRPF